MPRRAAAITPGIARCWFDSVRRGVREQVVSPAPPLAKDELQHLGVGLVSLREALDLASPIGRAMFGIGGVLAEVERAWVIERTHAGLRRARAQRKRLGRPSAAPLTRPASGPCCTRAPAIVRLRG